MTGSLVNRSRRGPRQHACARPLGVLTLLCAALVARPVQAIDAIVLEVGGIDSGAIRAENTVIKLALVGDERTTLEVSAAKLTLPQPVGPLRRVHLRCDDPTIAEPVFGCAQGRITAVGGPTGSIAASIQGEYRTDTGAAFLNGAGLVVAGAKLDWRAQLRSAAWRVTGNVRDASLVELRKFAARWVELPSEFTYEGAASASFAAHGTGGVQQADITASFSNVNFTNEDGTIVGEALAADLDVGYAPGAKGDAVRIELAGDQGQALLGPVLLDLGVNPVQLDARGTLREKSLSIATLDLRQRDLLVARGSGSVSLAGATPSISAQLGIEKLQFPAAYTSFLQIALAATDFGDLTTSGQVRGAVTIDNNRPQSLTLQLADVDLLDRKGRVRIDDIAGIVHWRDGTAPAVAESTLRWSSGGAYGLSGGAAEIRFRAQGDSVALTRPARLPVFDGAVAIENFALNNLGADDLGIDFEAEIEPISMPLICAAFGWPTFAGTLSGRVPALTFRDRELRVAGDVEAAVFGGKVVGSNLRLQDPFGRWPRLFADVRARELDLSAVTNTFAFGSITGKLEADVLGLELFAWSPVAFDARLETPPGDRSRKRISAKAVGNLSNIGGGGGGVIAALQSGFLRFFDDFGYSKLGLKCQLRDGVCLMSGIEPARDDGYYIVKGRGIPRIDIIGNAGRVDWPRLVSQISAGMAAENVEVR